MNKRIIVLEVVMMLILIINSSVVISHGAKMLGEWDDSSPVDLPTSRMYGVVEYMSSVEKVLLFGGVTAEGLDNHTLIYDPQTSTWQVVDTTGPSERYGHSGAYIAEIDKVIIAGGISAENRMLNDTWLFDPQTLSWELLSNESYIFGVHGSMTYDSIEDDVYYFGGVYTDVNNTVTNNFYKFSISNLEWQQVNTSSLPSERYRHVLQYDPMSESLILFGGLDKDFREMTDTWVFNVNNNSWSNPTVIRKPDSFGYYSWNTGVASTFNPDMNLTMFSRDLTIWTYDVAEERWIDLDNSGGGDFKLLDMSNQFTYIGNNTLFHFSGMSEYHTLSDHQYIYHFTDQSHESVSDSDNDDIPEMTIATSGSLNISDLIFFHSFVMIILVLRSNRNK